MVASMLPGVAVAVENGGTERAHTDCDAANAVDWTADSSAKAVKVKSLDELTDAVKGSAEDIVLTTDAASGAAT